VEKNTKRDFGGEIRQPRGDLDVDLMGQERVLLTGGGFADGSAMDDGGRSLSLEKGPDGSAVRQVESAAVERAHLKVAGWSGLHKMTSDQSTRSRDPD